MVSQSRETVYNHSSFSAAPPPWKAGLSAGHPSFSQKCPGVGGSGGADVTFGRSPVMELTTASRQYYASDFLESMYVELMARHLAAGERLYAKKRQEIHNSCCHTTPT
jgi:hypothetical protein